MCVCVCGLEAATHIVFKKYVEITVFTTVQQEQFIFNNCVNLFFSSLKQ